MKTSEMNRLLSSGRARAESYEDKLAAAVESVLRRAGEKAARQFRAHTGAAMVAAAPTDRSAMIAVYPTPEQAAMLAQKGGEPSEILHVTLAFLGEVDPDQEEQIVGIVRDVAADYGLLEGTVGGVATFGASPAERPEEEPQGSIFDAAIAHAPEGGYGNTYWNAEEKAVYWVPADWSTDDEQEAALAAFLAIDGVEQAPPVESEAAGPSDGWEAVWTEGMIGPYPSILLPDVTGLAELRQGVCDALDAAGIEYATNHGWTPHLTLAYTPEPSPPPTRLIGLPLTFEALTFAVGDRPRDVELGGDLTAAAPRACTCGHAYRDHLGDDGPCEISDCSCKEYTADESLAASAMITTYELNMGGQAHRVFEEESMKAGFKEASSAEWPSEADLLDPKGELLYREDGAGVYRLPDGTLACVACRGGWFRIHVSSPSRMAAHSTISAFATAYPPLYRSEVDDGLVPITFWALGNFGPTRRLRMVEASAWDEIAKNYTAPVRDELATMMSDFEPGKSGQLILWQGPPGTGKTWALRALAAEWRSWAEFHYITDPDSFFVSSPDYMIDVLLSDSYEEYAEIDGETEVVQTDREGKWRVLILEDTGELLAANAKESYGQGLSRLLNVVDGLVGQGLRVLVLVTTNDELGDLHPAVKRPGRCAVQLTFAELTDEEAAAWSGEEGIGAGTIAELYDRMNSGAPALEEAGEIIAAAFRNGFRSLQAAGDPDPWVPPTPDELVDADALVEELHTKTDPIRQAVIADIVAPVVEGVGLNFDTTNPFVDGVLNRTGQHISYIADTTRLNALRIVRRAYEEGLSVPDTARAIQAGMASASKARARMIARTELAALTNGGTLAATRIVRDATGIVFLKRWLTAAGAKHPRHSRYPGLNGQTVELDERFNVAGSRLDHPGDPDGPPDQVINCRCTTIMIDPEDKEMLDQRPPGEVIPEMTPLTPESGDMISAPSGPPVPAAMRAKIEQLGLYDWPPRKTPLARKVFGNADDTVGLHKRGGQWTAERKGLHDKIVASHFDGKVVAPGQRRAYFTSGGASGKSHAVFDVGGKDLGLKDLGSRRDVVHIDPDRIKEMLPEYKLLRDKNDFYAAAGVHEESSELAKRITSEAQRRGLSVIVDTTGSSSSFVQKLEAARHAGYDVRVTMFSIDTNEAIVRSMARGERRGRYVAIQALKKAHAGSSRQLRIWQSSTTVTRWRVYDNSGLKPRLVAERIRGEVVIYDRPAFERILAKGNE